MSTIKAGSGINEADTCMLQENCNVMYAVYVNVEVAVALSIRDDRIRGFSGITLSITGRAESSLNL